MPRVCMLVHQDYFYDARVIRYAEALVEQQVEVDVLALRGGRGPSGNLPPGLTVYTIPLRRLSYLGRGYLREYALACVLFTLWLLPLYLRRRYDIIHVHNMPDFLIFTALIPRLLGARLVLDIHDPMPEVFLSKFGGGRESRAVQLMMLQERCSAWLASAVITANERFRKLLIGRGISAGKIIVVNNLPDPEIFTRDAGVSCEEGGAFTLLYPGTIAPRYGLEVAIKALPTLTEQIPELRLRILGASSSHREELARLAEQLAVSRWVEFGGVIPLHEVPRAMLQASIGIYPAYSDAHMAIATPSKVLEYAVMGLPIVAARLPILTDMFSAQAVRYFEPGNVEQFTRCILELYNDPAQRAGLVREADREYVSRNSWANERERYMALIESLLQREQRHARI